MRKAVTFLVILTTFFFIKADTASAEICVAEPSAQIKDECLGYKPDYRASTLRSYLDSHQSPLSGYAENFVAEADKYDLDWRFVPAITGVESTFGKKIPYRSYNAYGWANGAYYFESWDDSIEIVSKTLREKYIDRGAVSVNQIARRYAPPSSTWAGKVRYFMNKIDPLPLTFTI